MRTVLLTISIACGLLLSLTGCTPEATVADVTKALDARGYIIGKSTRFFFYEYNDTPRKFEEKYKEGLAADILKKMPDGVYTINPEYANDAKVKNNGYTARNGGITSVEIYQYSVIVTNVLKIENIDEGYTTGKGVKYVPYTVTFEAGVDPKSLSSVFKRYLEYHKIGVDEVTMPSKFRIAMYYEPDSKRWTHIPGGIGVPKRVSE